MKETEIDNLESHIPLLARGAAQKAYMDALASGHSVLEVIEGYLYEVFADGTRKKIKEIKAGKIVEMGKKVLLK